MALIAFLCTVTSASADSVRRVPNPDVITLANAANDAYNDQPSTLNGYVPISVAGHENGDFGFGATAYKNGDQIVIAIRGTQTDTLKNGAYNLIADKSFGGGTITAAMKAEAAQTASFINRIAASNPEAKITLTGHSLGGALAQMAADATGVSATTFDAPGATAAYNAGLKEIFLSAAGGNIIGNSKDITNWRAYGDQVSKIGKQLGAEITIDQGKAQATIDASLFSNALDNHSMDMLAGQVKTYCSKPGANCETSNLLRWCNVGKCGTSPANLTYQTLLSNESIRTNGFRVTPLGCGQVTAHTGGSYAVNSPDGRFYRSECMFVVAGSPNFPGYSFEVIESADSLTSFSAMEGDLYGQSVYGGAVGDSLLTPVVGTVKTFDGLFVNRVLSNPLLNMVNELAVENSKKLMKTVAMTSADMLVAGVDRAASALLDPPPGNAYRLTQQPGSPDLLAVDLPINSDIAGWALKYHDDNGWSGIGKQMGHGLFEFLEGVDSFDAVPLDYSGAPEFNPSPFFIHAFFEPGLPGYTTIYSITAANDNDIPEPKTLYVFFIGFAALVIARRLKSTG